MSQQVARLLSRMLTRFYPRAFRRAYAAEMEHVFQDIIEEDLRRGRPWALVRAFVALVGETVIRAPTEHGHAAYDRITNSGRHPRPNREPMQTFLRDLRHGARALAKRPGFTIVAVLTLALGIGANTAIFSIVNSVLLRPLPYYEPDRLVILWESMESAGMATVPLSQADYADYRDQVESFSHLAVFNNGANLVLTGEGEPEQLSVYQATASAFPLFGARAIHGRLFNEAEEHSGAGQVVVLGFEFWTTRFGADPGVIGTTVSLSDQAYEVLGVLDPAFQFPPPVTFGNQMIATSNVADIWVPLTMDPANLNRGAHGLFAFGRLKPSVTPEQASAEVAQVAQRIDEETGAHPGIGAYVVGLHEQGVSRLRPALYVMLGAVGFVLLIACANLANLLLARAGARRQEIAVRAAVGASRGRLVSQMLTESFLLAGIGGLLGVGVAKLSATLLIRANPIDLPSMFDATLDPPVLAFLVAASAGTAVLFGLFPALQISRVDLRGALQGGRTTAGRGELRAKNALIVGQMAVALLLLVGAGLLVRSFVELQRLDPGIEPANLLTFAVALPEPRYQDDGQGLVFADQVLDRLASIPGVRRVGATQSIPFTLSRQGSNYVVEGEPTLEPGQLQIAEFRQVSEDYFPTMGIRLLEGRAFQTQDNENALSVVLVNQTLARRHWPNEDPVGQRLTFGSGTGDDVSWAVVVGVVGDVRTLGLMSPVEPTVYYSMRQRPSRNFWFAVRTSGDPISFMPEARRAIWELDPDLPIVDPQPMERRIRASVNQPRFITMIFALFGGAALILAAIGVYGVVSFAVTQQTRDIGVRIAFGAAPKAVLKMVLGRALLLIAAGMAIGLIGAVFAARLLSNLLFGVAATDMVTYGSVTALLAGIAVLATLVPARRATRVDPVTALRAE